jgi:hypothetical protein
MHERCITAGRERLVLQAGCRQLFNNSKEVNQSSHIMLGLCSSTVYPTCK